MYNEIDGDFKDVAINTFKVSLPIEHDLRKSLIGKPVTSVHQLVDQIDKYKRVQQQGKVKRRLYLKKGGISGRTDSTIIDLEEITLDSPGLPTPRRLMLCSENRCIRFSRRLRTSRFLNGRTKWLETPRGATKVFIANTIKTRDTLQRIAGICGTIWISCSEKES